MGIRNFEGLHLYSGNVLPLDKIEIKHFPDLDCLAIKPVGIRVTAATGKKDLTISKGKKDLEKSFPNHVHVQPARKGWIVSNWSTFFQKSML